MVISIIKQLVGIILNRNGFSGIKVMPQKYYHIGKRLEAIITPNVLKKEFFYDGPVMVSIA